MTRIEMSRDEYLKAIYKLLNRDEKVSNKTLAQYLGVSAPSVTEMLRRLVDNNDVQIEKRAIKLTKEGVTYVEKLLTKHRLWERFLVDYLGYSWQDVHDDADALEHVTSEVLKDRLNEFLNHPKHCPHGSEIYENHTMKDNLICLAEMKKGDEAFIHKLRDQKEFLRYIEQKGLFIDQKLTILDVDDFDKTMTVQSDDKKLFISEKVAQKIMMIFK